MPKPKGIKTSTSICRNSETDEQVDDELCNGSMKPEDMQFACNTNQCQLKYVLLPINLLRFKTFRRNNSLFYFLAGR